KPASTFPENALGPASRVVITLARHNPAAKLRPGEDGSAAMARQLYIPALRRIYDWEAPFAEPLLRIALGAILIPHGMQKLFGAFGGAGLTANAALFERLGFSPGMFWGTLVACTEFFGGILLVLGLFTRFAAAAVAIFMINAILVTSKAGGFFWTN